ncbi:iron chelate uptake ABC transporter family permease subunit, partial [Rhizobium ruizarguesonis]
SVARGFNAIIFGEEAAFHMGVLGQRLKSVAIVGFAAATGASVAVSGGNCFVGIVVPHILRIAIGPDHRFLLPTRRA